ncbi:LPS export ABC transporter permease LptG [Endozoicomonadaceae bacterium StTr2]
MRKLDRYIGFNVLGAMLLVLIVIVALNTLFGFMAQLESLRANYQVPQAILFTVLNIPKAIYQAIPVSALIGCLVGLGGLAANSELVVMRAAGVSLKRIIWAVMKPALVLMLIGGLVGEYLAPWTGQIAETGREIARSAKGTYSGDGIWHREGNEFMYFNAVEPNGVLYGVSRFKFDDEMQLKEASYASRALFQEDHWVLEQVKTSHFAGDKVTIETALTEIWNVDLDTTLLKVVVVNPDELSISGLSTYMKYLKEQGLNAGEYALAYWNKVFQPLSIFALVMIGISFVFGPLRSVSMGLRIFTGVITGVAFMIVQQLMGPSSLVFGFSPIIAVLTPILICLIVGSILLRRAG